MAERAEPWHLDKRIPIALILAILVQSIAGVWWLSDLVHRLDSAVAINDRQDGRISAVEAVMNAQAVSSATLTAQMDALRDGLNEVKEAQAETNRLLRNLGTNGVLE